MKPVSGKRMCAILEAQGWTLIGISSSHHLYRRPGHRRAISVPVHKNADMPTGTQRAVMRQAGLTEADLTR